jgi:hypothetical protein
MPKAKFADPADTKPRPPANVMRGPDHAENYRVKVGRYSDRWYCDPLPADDIAPASPDEEAWPSVSIVKKASGSDWTMVGLKRVANAPDLDVIAQGGYFERYEKLKVINKLGLSAAARRGTNVHAWAECLAYGVPPYLTHRDEGSTFFGTVDRIWADYQPKLVAAEFVAIHRGLNGVGYGGTSDGVFEIDGKLYMVDWKSRGDDSEHGCYPEEAAQLGAYGRAEYVIVADDDPANPHGAHRKVLGNRLAGGLIFSIKSDSYEVYPVDLDKGFDHFSELHGWWIARRSERKAIGRKWAPRRTAQSPDDPVSDTGEGRDVGPSIEEALADPALADAVAAVDRKQALYDRYDALSAEQQEQFRDEIAGSDASDLDIVEQVLNGVENPPTLIESAQRRMKLDAEREAERADSRLSDDEGGPAAHEDVKHFEAIWGLGVSDAGKGWIAAIVQHAINDGLDFRLSTKSTQRRADIYCALCEWASCDYFDADDSSGFVAALHTVTGTVTLPIGRQVGGLTTAEAAALRHVVTEIVADRMVLASDSSDVASRWTPAPTTTTSES